MQSLYAKLSLRYIHLDGDYCTFDTELVSKIILT